MLGPVFASHKYDLTLAENATTAAEYLRRRQFDAIIVDIRLPPGTDAYWRGIYMNAGSDRTNAKLGLALLGWLLPTDSDTATDETRRKSRKKSRARTPDRPAWAVSPDHIGVFSVEARGEIGDDLETMGVSVQHEKRPGLPDTVLLDILCELLPEHSRP